ncbi:MAG: 3-phosphoshikimate 1-carboxyvinyltransferase [Syntrophaceae bacterium PtaU1.Bin231]|nr:MAG: 3-phosphoshikimate 1-carboxyvinyltransferase [Syntrophaceae bacterium PtaU1.Bin231]HOG17978.1 3-phosphoshikimate 1-carboxyvinyltransferase [Syntrophales bacterium]
MKGNMAMEERKVRPRGPLRGVVRVPGSKSHTQRALIVASLADGESRIEHPLFSEDTRLLAAALRRLGAEIVEEGSGLRVRGCGGVPAVPEGEIFLGNNGTAMRFLLSVVSLGRGKYRLTGDARLCERPVGGLADALGRLGVTMEDRNGCPPVVVHAAGMRGGVAELADIRSSQFVSSLLLAAPYAAGDVVVALRGSTVSEPYIDMTVRVMADFGVSVLREETNRYRVPAGQRYRGRGYRIEGDASSASYFFLAAALCGGSVRVLNVRRNGLQGDIRFLDILESLGCRVRAGEDWIEVEGAPRDGAERSFDMGGMPDMVPTLAVLAAFRPGRTIVSRVPHLRLKESDRLSALAVELRKIGAGVVEKEDGLTIDGGNPHGATIETYRDHRIAMSFAVAGLAVPGMKISDPACVTKSFPTFWEEIERL